MRSPNDQEMGTVNVDEGFLPKFSDAFLERYGRESILLMYPDKCSTLFLSGKRNRGVDGYTVTARDVVTNLIRLNL